MLDLIYMAVQELRCRAWDSAGKRKEIYGRRVKHLFESDLPCSIPVPEPHSIPLPTPRRDFRAFLHSCAMMTSEPASIPQPAQCLESETAPPPIPGPHCIPVPTPCTLTSFPACTVPQIRESFSYCSSFMLHERTGIGIRTNTGEFIQLYWNAYSQVGFCLWACFCFWEGCSDMYDNVQTSLSFWARATLHVRAHSASCSVWVCHYWDHGRSVCRGHCLKGSGRAAARFCNTYSLPCSLNSAK